MDPFSQAGLGAVVAQAAGHRQLGYKAALFGAVAGALPDLDVLFSIGGDFVDQLITHRGITHSLFFAPVVGPVLGWLIWQRERRQDPGVDPARRQAWMLVITLALLSHPLLDVLTPYGTQLLLPFSDARFAINAMPIIDPLYTFTLAAGLAAGWLIGRDRGGGTSTARPVLVALITLLLTTGYLGYGWLQNIRAETAAMNQLARTGVTPERLSAFPTILQVHLRRVVARSAGVDRVGFYSTWAPCDITWFAAPTAPPSAYQAFLETRAGRVFDWFTMGWAHYRLMPTASGSDLIVSDLRYGFDDDPLASVFTVIAGLDRNGSVIRPASAGRNVPEDSERALEQLVANTYTPACQLFNTGAIPDVLDENEASAAEPGFR